MSGLVTGIEKVKEIATLLTPDVEAGVAAIEPEKARLQATMDNVRQELDKVSVEGVTDEALKASQEALEKSYRLWCLPSAAGVSPRAEAHDRRRCHRHRVSTSAVLINPSPFTLAAQSTPPSPRKYCHASNKALTRKNFQKLRVE